MRLTEVVSASAAVAATSSRLDKIGRLAELLKRTPSDQIETVVAFLTGSTRQGRMGIGGATLHQLRDVPPAGVPSLDIADIDAAFDRIAQTAGRGSASARDGLLRQLLGRS